MISKWFSPLFPYVAPALCTLYYYEWVWILDHWIDVSLPQRNAHYVQLSRRACTRVAPCLHSNKLCKNTISLDKRWKSKETNYMGSSQPYTYFIFLAGSPFPHFTLTISHFFHSFHSLPSIPHAWATPPNMHADVGSCVALAAMCQCAHSIPIPRSYMLHSKIVWYSRCSGNWKCKSAGHSWSC